MQVASILNYQNLFTPAQLVGYVAVITYVLGYLVRSDDKLKLIFSASNVLWIIHYLWIGARTAALTTVIITARNLLSLNSENFSKRKKIWLSGFFSVLLIVAGIVTWSGFVSIIPVCACIAVSFGMIYLHGLNLRVLLLMLDAAWFYHGLLVGSLGGMAYGAIAVSVNAGAMVYLFSFSKPEAP